MKELKALHGLKLKVYISDFITMVLLNYQLYMKLSIKKLLFNMRIIIQQSGIITNHCDEIVTRMNIDS